MCGFSVIIGKDTNRIKEITDLIKHRGPDAEDFYFGDGFSMGHRRLAILDLSDDGKQPMVHAPTQNMIVFNGEIYNYLELKVELEKLGHTFHTKTDTEVILAAYAEWGEECVKRFNGMWTFVIFNHDTKSFLISRDRFGVKPLYFYQDQDNIVLGSEIKQLLPFTKTKVNLDYLTGYLVTGILDYNEETFFHGITKILPSFNYHYDFQSKKISRTRYFDLLENNQGKLSPESALDKFSALFKSSIALRLRSDVKVGTCLSGGLDSSAVASIASDAYTGDSKFQGVFARSSDPSTDESRFADLVAKHKDIELNTITPSYEEFLSHVDEIVYTQEEPFVSPSIFMQYFVMKKAKEIGCKVMLDGQGGDETLLGYEKYYPAVLYEKWKDGGSYEFFQALRDLNSNNLRFSPFKLFKYFFGMISWRVRLFGHFYQARVLKSQFLINNYWYLKTLSRCVLSSSFSLQRFEIYHTNLQSLLRYEDKNSMRHSIEARLPFMDYRLVEFNLNLSSEHKINGGWSKFILRKFLEDKLPFDVTWRKKKMGFEAPEMNWIKEHEPIMKQEILNSPILKHISNQRLDNIERGHGAIFWRLYNIAVWERIYKVRLS